MKSANGFVGGRGFKFDESEKEYKRVKQRMQQATFDPDAAVDMDTVDADAVCYSHFRTLRYLILLL